MSAGQFLFGVLAVAILAAAARHRRRPRRPPPHGTRHIPQDVKIAVSVRDGGRCRRCGSQVNLHYDHIVPFSRGGTATAGNIQLLCSRCNLRKGNS